MIYSDKTSTKEASREQMNVVVIGHVDHGKSTVIGRLLADTGSLPEGKLESVKANCVRNSRPFEYAFLLDALKDEQRQGITIDTARCFFKSKKREYIIIDAPGHIEFLKNMISGAARAEAALLVIDAAEGVKENSRRHGYLLGMLGIRQVAVAVNKMDLVGYKRETFEAIQKEFAAFLSEISIKPKAFIPISAREGENMTQRSGKMSWYQGPAILEMFDAFSLEASREKMPLRFPIQDIYKFTEQNDDRRIFSGRIETGMFHKGDEVIFLPSGKRSTIKSIEAFNMPEKLEAAAGESTGVQLETQVYIKPGEVMCLPNQKLPFVSTQFRTNIFWMGRQPMIKDKRYKIKLAGAREAVWLREIHNILDASDLSTDKTKQQIDRHDVAECTLEFKRPLSFDLNQDIQQTGRFVIIDHYEIAGGGVILANIDAKTNRVQDHVKNREKWWERSRITPDMRQERFNQKATLILITGATGAGKVLLATALEESLFQEGRTVYYLGLASQFLGVKSESTKIADRDEFLFRLGEVAHLFSDAGIILIASVSDLDDYELENIKTLNYPHDCLHVHVGENTFDHAKIDLLLPDAADHKSAIARINTLLHDRNYFEDFSI